MHSSTTRTRQDDAILYELKVYHSIVVVVVFSFNIVATVLRAGRFTITNEPCSDALQDNNSAVYTELSSIVVSGVSGITT